MSRHMSLLGRHATRLILVILFGFLIIPRPTLGQDSEKPPNLYLFTDKDYIALYVASDCPIYVKGLQFKVFDDAARPGHYKILSHIRPHYQLEALNASIRLVSNLPTVTN